MSQSNGLSRRLVIAVLASSLFGIGGFAAAYANEPGTPSNAAAANARVPAEDVALLERVSSAFHRVAQAVGPSVVSISARGSRRGAREASDDGRYSSSAGSGVIFDAQGHIVTSNHVVADSGQIEVELYDGRNFRATVVGRDPKTDTALLKISASRLQPAVFGDSDRIEVGHLVLSVGSPFKLAQTVSHGIVSAKGRTGVNLSIDYQDFIQTDVPTNPGNSGGALVNVRGEVIGINTAIATDSGNFAGVAFATPSNIVVSIAHRLMSGKPVVRGYLGVQIDPVQPELAERHKLNGEGVLIQKVESNSPAARSGLRANDIVLRVDGRQIRTVSELQIKIAGLSPGARSAFTVLRDGAEQRIEILVGEQPNGFSTSGGLRDPIEEDERQTVRENARRKP